MKSPSELNIVVIQTCVPDYRLPFFDELARLLPQLRVFSGEEFFSADIKNGAGGKPWSCPVHNVFFAFRNLAWQRGLWRAAADADVLVAELNVHVLSSMLLLLYRRLRGRPTLLWGHVWGRHGFSRFIQWPRVTAARFADGVIAYTESDAQQIVQKIPRERVHVATNSCVLEQDCGVAKIAGVEPQHIIYVGRLAASKKPGLLLEGFAQALASLPSETELHLVGDGREQSALASRAAALGIADRVKFYGRIADLARLREFYAGSLVAVSPGYVGLSVIQCMAFGIPMLVARDENHSPEIEACKEGENCLFFDSDDTKSLAKALVKMFDERTVWLHRRSMIAQHIAQNYSIEKMAAGYARAIRAVDPAPGLGTIALVWEQFGPYHLARLHAAQERLGSERVIGVEMASKISTYNWTRDDEASSRLVTLCPGKVAETTNATTVYHRALRAFRKHRTKIVFVPSYWPRNSLAILWAAKAAGARCVMMNESHAGTAKARGWLGHIKIGLVRSFDAALVGGTPQRDYFEGLGMPPGRIFDGYDAVDNEYFAMEAKRIRENAAEFRAAFGLPQRYFLNVGRMEPKKDLATLVSAYAEARGKRPDFPSLVLVGSGSLYDSLRLQALDYGLRVQEWRGEKASGAQPELAPADVYFMGFRQINTLPAFYALSTAFVLPSVSEEWGLVVNEAMASGVPVVASDAVGSAVDLVYENQTGLLFQAGDHAGLAAHLLVLADDPSLAAKMGLAAEERVKEWGLDRFSGGVLSAVNAVSPSCFRSTRT